MNRLYWIILLLMMAVAAHGQMDSTVINLKNVVVTGKAGTKSVTAPFFLAKLFAPHFAEGAAIPFWEISREGETIEI